MLNTYDNFTLFQYFGQRPLSRKNKHLSINYIVKHIRRDFHSATWVMPRGGTWGYRGGGSKKNFFSEIQPDLVEISSENTALFDLGSLVSLNMKHYPCLIKG